MAKQLDNPTFTQKRALRLSMLREVSDPVVMETHGGIGKLFASCYSTFKRGVVFEIDQAKADVLATQRPTWSVYRADCVRSLEADAGAHLPVNFLDLDPYGSPWNILSAFFHSRRPFPERLALVVNDGMRQKARIGGAWTSEILHGVCAKYGNARIHKNYKEICAEIFGEMIAPLGYSIAGWTAYYTGAHADMTHWAAVLARAVKIDQPVRAADPAAESPEPQESHRPVESGRFTF